jgi:hypothetical protein
VDEMSTPDCQIENLIAQHAFLVTDVGFAGLGELMARARIRLGTTAFTGSAEVERSRTTRCRPTPTARRAPAR